MIHSPTTTKKALNKFNLKCKFDFYNSSYKNDLCDSLEYEIREDEFLRVYIPNSKKYDENKELYNTYTIFQDSNNILFESKKLKEVIKFINKNY